MALPKENVAIAIKVFEKITGGKMCMRVVPYGKSLECKGILDEIILFGPCADYGYENVVLNIKNITAGQEAMWHDLKKEVKGNTNFISPEGNGITMVGWI